MEMKRLWDRTEPRKSGSRQARCVLPGRYRVRRDEISRRSIVVRQEVVNTGVATDRENKFKPLFESDGLYMIVDVTNH